LPHPKPQIPNPHVSFRHTNYNIIQISYINK
jgi:hypothetical protein